MAHVAGGAGQSCREGSSVALLAEFGLLLLAMAGVLGVVRWQGMLLRMWWAFSQCWHRHTGDRRGGTRQST